MPCCSANNCTNRWEQGFRMFRFPSLKSKRLEKWLQNMRRGGNWTPSVNSRLCEKHFDTSQFENKRADGLRKLKPNAIPTLFDIPSSQPPLSKNLTRKPSSTANESKTVQESHVPAAQKRTTEMAITESSQDKSKKMADNLPKQVEADNKSKNLLNSTLSSSFSDTLNSDRIQFIEDDEDTTDTDHLDDVDENMYDSDGNSCNKVLTSILSNRNDVEISKLGDEDFDSDSKMDVLNSSTTIERQNKPFINPANHIVHHKLTTKVLSNVDTSSKNVFNLLIPFGYLDSLSSSGPITIKITTESFDKPNVAQKPPIEQQFKVIPPTTTISRPILNVQPVNRNTSQNNNVNDDDDEDVFPVKILYREKTFVDKKFCWTFNKNKKRDLDGFAYKDIFGFSVIEYMKTSRCSRQLKNIIRQKEWRLLKLIKNSGIRNEYCSQLIKEIEHVPKPLEKFSQKRQKKEKVKKSQDAPESLYLTKKVVIVRKNQRDKMKKNQSVKTSKNPGKSLPKRRIKVPARFKETEDSPHQSPSKSSQSKQDKKIDYNKLYNLRPCFVTLKYETIIENEMAKYLTKHNFLTQEKFNAQTVKDIKHLRLQTTKPVLVINNKKINQINFLSETLQHNLVYVVNNKNYPKSILTCRPFIDALNKKLVHIVDGKVLCKYLEEQRPVVPTTLTSSISTAS